MSKISLGDINQTSQKPKKSAISEDIAGAVSYTIGTGRHAQDSVVWLTIKWSLSLGFILSVVLIIFMWPCSDSAQSSSPTFPIEDLKTIWSIFVPIVTLALGYMFGKGK